MYVKQEKMEDNRNQLLNYAIYAGLFLGGFWVLKYILVIIGGNNNFIGIIVNLLSIGTPVLLFYYLIKYNESIQGNAMGYWHGVQFSILLFFFASILESVIVFIHVKWIDPVYISNLYESIIELAQTLEFNKAITAQIIEQPLPSAFSYVISNVILADVFLGLLLSLFIVPLAKRFKPQQNI